MRSLSFSAQFCCCNWRGSLVSVFSPPGPSAFCSGHLVFRYWKHFAGRWGISPGIQPRVIGTTGTGHCYHCQSILSRGSLCSVLRPAWAPLISVRHPEFSHSVRVTSCPDCLELKGFLKYETLSIETRKVTLVTCSKFEMFSQKIVIILIIDIYSLNWISNEVVQFKGKNK